MISCYLKYKIDPYKIKEFEHYARLWIELVPKFGGVHLGYFLPHESNNDLAVAIFNFDSLASYEQYRIASQTDEACIEANQYAEKTRCIQSYERSFLRPIP